MKAYYFLQRVPYGRTARDLRVVVAAKGSREAYAALRASKPGLQASEVVECLDTALVAAATGVPQIEVMGAPSRLEPYDHEGYATARRGDDQPHRPQ